MSWPMTHDIPVTQPPPGKVVMYYDGACPICSREVAFYQCLDRDGRVAWRNLHDAGAELSALGVSHDAAMGSLHVRDASGRLHRGVRSFPVIWRELPWFRYLAPLFRLPGVTPVAERVYRYWASRRTSRPAKKAT